MDLCIENNDRRYDITARSYFEYVKSGVRAYQKHFSDFAPGSGEILPTALFPRALREHNRDLA